jgi:hypothetical protein
MKAVLSVLAVTIVGAVGPSRATAGEPDQKKLYARCVDCSALIFGPESTKEPAPLAGAIILDRDKRLVLARSYNVPDAPTAIFPAYTAKGELRNRPTDYPDLWRKGELWKGKVLHRDKWRDVTVIELDRALPDRALPAE